MKRFYNHGSVEAADAAFLICLDGRRARSPAGGLLALPTPALAALIAAEWSAQPETVAFTSMPATRLAHTALDAIPAARAATVAALAEAADADLICYRAEAPASLAARQDAVWGSLAGWAEAALGLPLRVTTGVRHQPQPAAVASGVAALAETADDFTLAGLAFGSALFSSPVIALALRAGRLDAAAALAAARLDETFQEERWGVDAENARRTALLARDAAMLEAWFRGLEGLGSEFFPPSGGKPEA